MALSTPTMETVTDMPLHTLKSHELLNQKYRSRLVILLSLIGRPQWQSGALFCHSYVTSLIIVFKTSLLHGSILHLLEESPTPVFYKDSNIKIVP